MMLAKVKVAAVGLFSIALLAGGAGLLVGQTTKRETDPLAPAAKGVRALTPAGQDVERPRPKAQEDDLKRRLVDAARRRFETQQAFYKEGRITLDRFLDASDQLRSAEIQASRTQVERVAAARTHLDRVKSIESNEREELEAGRGTVADVAEAAQVREQAELDLIETEKPDGRPEMEALRDRVKAVEAQLDRVLKELQELKGRRDQPGK